MAEVVAAAEEALRLGDLELSERLGRAALERSSGLDVRLTLGYALAWQGRGRDAEAVLADVDPAALSETELMAWALPRAANQFWMLSEPERATAFLQTTRNRVTVTGGPDHARRTVGTFAMNAGSPQRAMQIADRGAGVADGRRHGGRLGGVGGGAELRPDGPFAEVDALAERAVAADIPACCGSPAGSARPPRC